MWIVLGILVALIAILIAAIVHAIRRAVGEITSTFPVPPQHPNCRCTLAPDAELMDLEALARKLRRAKEYRDAVFNIYRNPNLGTGGGLLGKKLAAYYRLRAAKRAELSSPILEDMSLEELIRSSQQ